MIQNVISDCFQQCPTCHLTSYGMNTRSFKCLGRQGPQDADHLATDDIDQSQLFRDVSLVVGEMLDKLPSKATGECRLIFGDDMFHPVSVNRIEVGLMADDLTCCPFAGQRRLFKVQKQCYTTNVRAAINSDGPRPTVSYLLNAWTDIQNPVQEASMQTKTGFECFSFVRRDDPTKEVIPGEDIPLRLFFRHPTLSKASIRIRADA